MATQASLFRKEDFEDAWLGRALVNGYAYSSQRDPPSVAFSAAGHKEAQQPQRIAQPCDHKGIIETINNTSVHRRRPEHQALAKRIKPSQAKASPRMTSRTSARSVDRQYHNSALAPCLRRQARFQTLRGSLARVIMHINQQQHTAQRGVRSHIATASSGLPTTKGHARTAEQ